jgi:hypothetical protein
MPSAVASGAKLLAGLHVRRSHLDLSGCLSLTVPEAIIALPGVVIRSRSAISAMYPSAIRRAECSTGITGARLFIGVLPTIHSEANSSAVSVSGSDAMLEA